MVVNITRYLFACKTSLAVLDIKYALFIQDILDHKICYESVAARDVTVNRRRRDTLDFTLSDGYNVEEGQLMFDVSYFRNCILIIRQLSSARYR